ncbi:MAG: hypothetical protein ACSHX6_12565 [Akkermansiaceae bacterium]
MTKILRSTLFSILTLALTSSLSAEENKTPPQAAQPSDKMMITVILRHDQTKSLDEIREVLDAQGFWEAFPPKGTKIVTWHVVMGIGQVITLEIPASKLRDVNLAIEKTAWKAFKTEFYPTYDLYPVIKDKLANPTKVKVNE